MEDTRLSLFIRLFGVALAAHVVGNWAQPDLPTPVAWVNLAVGVAGLVLVIRPARSLLLVSSVLVVASVILEMPITGNHWVLAGLVSTTIVVTGGDQGRFFPAARAILLVFYSFAAFAKLNSGFFDPTVSCAVFYASQSLSGFGLPPLDPAGIVSRALIWATVVIEISVPLALMWRRSRYLGVLVGTLFHTLISFDLNQHFYDFTAILIPLFVLFLPDRSIELIVEQWTKLTSQTARLGKVFLAIAGGLVLLAGLPLTPTTGGLLSRVPFILWVPLAVLWAVVLFRSRSTGSELTWRMSIGGAIVVAVAILNGLTPYTEVKTAYSFNMYANLVTSQGESNHYLVRATWPLRNGYDRPVEILESSDQGLRAYRDEGYLIAYPQLRRYLSNRPEVNITYRRDGEVVSLPEASSVPELVDPGPWWWRFFPLRAIDTRNPPRCQAVFLSGL